MTYKSPLQYFFFHISLLSFHFFLFFQHGIKAGSVLVMEISSMSTMGDISRATSFLPVSFPHPISFKLDNNNFLVWRKQVLTTLRGQKLQHFLSNYSVLPLKFLSQDDEIQHRINPEFIDYEQQDQPIMSWILMSISHTILTRMVNCGTSAQT